MLCLTILNKTEVYRRLRGDLIEVYKYLHGYYNVELNGLLPLVTPGLPTRGHSMKLLKSQCRTKVRSNFFAFQRAVNIWNSIAGGAGHCFFPELL